MIPSGDKAQNGFPGPNAPVFVPSALPGSSSAPGKLPKDWTEAETGALPFLYKEQNHQNVGGGYMPLYLSLIHI